PWLFATVALVVVLGGVTLWGVTQTVTRAPTRTSATVAETQDATTPGIVAASQAQEHLSRRPQPNHRASRCSGRSPSSEHWKAIPAMSTRLLIRLIAAC